MTEETRMELIPLPQALSVVQLYDLSDADLTAQPFFLAVTGTELSLVCEVSRVPARVRTRDDGWRALRIAGTLDFSLTGVLAGIADVLRDAHIPIFAVSTFDTDYVLVKADRFSAALDALCMVGYAVREG